MAVVNLKSQQNTLGALLVLRAELSSFPVITVGSAVRASTFNAIAGQTLVPAPSAAVAVDKVAHLWGVGYGDRGYGMTAPVLTTKIPGQSITSADWLNIRSIMASLVAWQDSTYVSLPAANTFDVNDSVFATQMNDLMKASAILDGERLSSMPINMTLSTNAASAARTDPWGSFTLQCSFTFELPSENVMRYFFNSGGDIRFTFSHTDTSNSRNIRWGNILNTLGISFGAHRTTQYSGSYAGLEQNIGYYELTEAWQTIFDGLNMSAYVINQQDVSLEARSAFIVGYNGAKGRVIEFRVTLAQDEAGFGDLIAGPTTVNLSHYRATTTVVIPSPTCTVTEPL